MESSSSLLSSNSNSSSMMYNQAYPDLSSAPSSFLQPSHPRSRITADHYKSSRTGGSNSTFSCFKSKAELQAAVGVYARSSPAGTASVSEAAKLYGYPMNTWCVYAVTDFTGVFMPLNSLDPLARFNEDVSGWDMSNAVTLDSMFEGAIAFNQDLSGWNLTSVQSTVRMFFGSISFDQNLCAWGETLSKNNNVSVTGMFNDTHCPAKNQDPVLWVASGNTTTITVAGPFCYPCRGLLNNSTQNATTLPGKMNATVPRTKSPAGIMNKTVSSTQSPSGMMNATVSPSKSPAGFINATISPTKSPAGFINATVSPTAAAATNNSSFSCFQDKVELELAIDAYLMDNGTNSDIAATYGWPINVWCVGAITNFSSLFSPVTNVLKSVFNEDISSWDLSSAVDVSNMFHGASFFNQDLSSWTFGSNLISMHRMFFSAQSFNQNFCAWSATVPLTAVTTQIFRDTACPYGTLDPPDAWCHVCPVLVQSLAPTSSPSSNRTTSSPSNTTAPSSTPANKTKPTSTPTALPLRPVGNTTTTNSSLPSLQPTPAVKNSTPSSSPVRTPQPPTQTKSASGATTATGQPTTAVLFTAVLVGTISMVLLRM